MRGACKLPFVSPQVSYIFLRGFLGALTNGGAYIRGGF